MAPSLPATWPVWPGAVAIIMVTVRSPFALALASRSASCEPSLSSGDLAVLTGPGAGRGSSAKAGAAPAVVSAATSEAATAIRAVRLAPPAGAWTAPGAPSELGFMTIPG